MHCYIIKIHLTHVEGRYHYFLTLYTYIKSHPDNTLIPPPTTQSYVHTCRHFSTNTHTHTRGGGQPCIMLSWHFIPDFTSLISNGMQLAILTVGIQFNYNYTIPSFSVITIHTEIRLTSCFMKVPAQHNTRLLHLPSTHTHTHNAITYTLRVYCTTHIQLENLHFC